MPSGFNTSVQFDESAFRVLCDRVFGQTANSESDNEYSETVRSSFNDYDRWRDTQTVKRSDISVGDCVFYMTPYDKEYYIVTTVLSDTFYGYTSSGSRNRFNKGSEHIYVFRSAKFIDAFCENVRDALDWNDDSSMAIVVQTIKDKYPDGYNSLNIENCSYCGNWAIPKVTLRGVVMCRDCYDERYVNCHKCGKTVERKDGFKTRSGHYLCAECNKRHWVLPYHYDYPIVEFYGDSKDNTQPFMGFELEVDCGGESNRTVEMIMPLLNKEDTGKVFAYCSHDSSIENGFEIITQPATMQYHYSIMDVYNRAIQKLKALGYASHETTTCGFHVHFNRTYFGDDEQACIRRLIIITEKFWDELCIFARRPERRMARYAKKVPKGMEISEYMRAANRSCEHDYHYYALNIANSSTIEFRMFRGTLNLNTIMATLQLVNNMVVAAKTKTEAEIRSMRFEDFLTNANQRKYWNRHKAVSDFEE